MHWVSALRRAARVVFLAWPDFASALEHRVMDWFALTLLCAVALAAADAFTKKFFSDCRGWELLVVRFGVPGIILLPLVFANPVPQVPPAFWGWMVLLVPLELAAMLLYMLAIRDSPLYLTLPYLAFTPVFNVLTAFVILGETVTWRGFAGVLLVVAGAYLLNVNHLRRGAVTGWLAPLRAILHERGSRLMLVVALIYSVTSALSKHVMQYATPLSFGPFYFAVIGGVVIAGALLWRPARLMPLARRPAPLLLVGALMSLMVVTHFVAIARVEVAYFISVKRSSLLFAIVFGALLFGERHVIRHFVAAAIMVAGIGLILI